MSKSSHAPKRTAKNPAPAAPATPAAPVLLNGVPYDPLAPGTNPYDPCDLFNPIVQAARLAAAPASPPPADPPAEPPPRRIDWHNPVDVAVWAREVYIQARDGLDAGDDATLPPGERELGRRAARRLITEALAKLEQLYRFADIDTRYLLDPDAKPPKR